jgi:SET domain-containing protein
MKENAAVGPDRIDLRVKVGISPIQGLGVFALRELPARKKVGQLGGRLVRLPAARRAVENSPQIYLVEISRRFALDCGAGGDFKHLNHSCEPNCFLRLYRRTIEVYTLRAIPHGVELTIDYGLTPHKGGMRCRCGSSRCRAAI